MLKRYKRDQVIRCLVGGALATLLLLHAHPVFADTAPSTDADILFQQLETSGTPVDINVNSGSAGNFAQFLGQRHGNMAPFVRLKMQMLNNGTTTGTLYDFSATSTIPVILEIFNASGCAMIRIGYFPTAWANDGQFHDFDWTPASAIYNANGNLCTITSGTAYNVGVFNGYSNSDFLAAANTNAVPYMINSVEPLDLAFPPPATPYLTGVVWQSATDHADEVSLNDNFAIPSTFNNTRFNTTIPLGIWTGPDFTTDASTTVHIWARSGDPLNFTILDVGIAVSSGGNPYTSIPDYVGNLIYGYPAYYAPHSAGWVPTGAPAGTTTQEQVLPTNWDVTIHHGDQLWGFAYPSFAAPFYNGGTNVLMGGTGNVPQYQICEGDCNQPPTPPAPQYCTPGSTPDCNDNVMFLPGIQGSRLYDVTGKVWESDDNGTEHLIMNSDGSSNHSDIYTKDVIGTISLTGGTFANVYQPFVDSMNDLKYSDKISDWEAIPYDWRLSLDQIISSGARVNSDGSISYLTATSSPYIIQELKRLSSSSRTGKVTIIAHSNGGLVTKELIEILGPDAKKYIDKVIFVAVPSIGTPQAVEGIVSGKGEVVPSHLSASLARFLANNMPMSYNLLPSRSFFTVVDNPVISFDPSTMQDWITKYGTNVVHSSDRLAAFLLDTSHSSPKITDSNLSAPVLANINLFSSSANTHMDLDNWAPPQGVQLFTIAGWGNETLSGITYKRVPEITCLQYDSGGTCKAFGQSQELTFEPNVVIDGDGTVVEPSALWDSGVHSSKYFVNLDAYNHDHDLVPLPDIYELLFTDHGRIFKVAELNQLLINIIEDGSNANIPNNYISTTQPPANTTKRLHFVLHSPLTLGFIDSSGNYTGSTATSTIFNIPGVDYERYGDVQWLSIPKSLAGQVVMRGTGSGSFALDIESVNGDTMLATTTFAAVPSSTSTVATININPSSDPTASATLQVDFNGDGTVDRILQAKQGNIVLPDITAPEATITVSTSTRDLAIQGVDDVPLNPIVVKGATSTIITDASGNKTTLFFQKTFTGGIITYARLIGINYGTSTVSLPSSFLYVWDSSKTLISQTVVADNNFGIEAIYNKATNKTTIIVKKKGSQIQATTLAGLKLVKLTTNKGVVRYSW